MQFILKACICIFHQKNNVRVFIRDNMVLIESISIKADTHILLLNIPRLVASSILTEPPVSGMCPPTALTRAHMVVPSRHSDY